MIIAGAIHGMRRDAADLIHYRLIPIMDKLAWKYEICGSYRRNEEWVGDIDYVVLGCSFLELKLAIEKMWPRAKTLRHGKKIMSVVVVPGIQIDFNQVDTQCWGAQLLHSTGSAIFNAQLRMFANSRGFKLNEYGLFEMSTIRLVASRTEEDIFAAMGLKYIPPYMRDEFFEIRQFFKL
jgi:DNA polymerase (family 10)